MIIFTNSKIKPGDAVVEVVETKIRKFEPVLIDAPWLLDHTGRLSPLAAMAPLAERISLLMTPGQITEVRAINVPHRRANGDMAAHTEAAFFAARSVNRLTLSVVNASLAGASGVYLTLNPVMPDLLSRAPNKLAWAKTGTLTRDADILRRQWLFIDCDPVRDPHVSATDAEKAAAIETAQRVRRDLRSRGWPEPILSDSGNGYHLLYRVDLPTNDGRLIERVLTAIAHRHDTDAVKIDRVVYNAARICKLPGTWACKGENTPERPWRLAQMLETPAGEIGCVPHELLVALAGEAPELSPTPAPNAAYTGTTSNRPIDGHYTSRLRMGEWLRDCGREYTVRHKADGTWYTITCPFHPDHTAEFVQRPDGKNGFKCFHARCRGYDYQAAKAAVGPQEGRHHFDPPLLGAKPWEDPEFDMSKEDQDEMIRLIFQLDSVSIAGHSQAADLRVGNMDLFTGFPDTASPELAALAARLDALPVQTKTPEEIEADFARQQLIQSWLDAAGIGDEFNPDAHRTCGYVRPLRKFDKRIRPRVLCRKWRGCDYCRQMNRHGHAKHWADWFCQLKAPLHRIEMSQEAFNETSRRKRGTYLRITACEPIAGDAFATTSLAIVYTTSAKLGGSALTPVAAAEQVVADLARAIPVSNPDGTRINATSHSHDWPGVPEKSENEPSGYVPDDDATVLSAAGVTEQQLIDALRRCGIKVWEARRGISITSDAAIGYRIDDVRHRKLIQWLELAATEGCQVHELAGWDPKLRTGPYDETRANSSVWSLEITLQTNLHAIPSQTMSV